MKITTDAIVVAHRANEHNGSTATEMVIAGYHNIIPGIIGELGKRVWLVISTDDPHASN